jgi:hypothetical protein
MPGCWTQPIHTVEEAFQLKANASMTNDLKYDHDKPRIDLLFDGMPHALEAVSKVLTFGAKKYKEHSWQTVDNGFYRYKAALLRHLIYQAMGEQNDPESDLHHLAHAACNALFILELALKKQEEKEDSIKPYKGNTITIEEMYD